MAELPVPGPVETRAMEPGRPHQAFVESRLRQYLRDNTVQGLVKPGRDDIRAAAMPILCRALRRRQGFKQNPYMNMAQRAVADVVEHIREKRWTGKPLTSPYAGADYIETLVRLAGDAGWLAMEVTLPQHPSPNHPSIYYRMDEKSGQPVPTEDSLIRGDYVYTRYGQRLTRASFIHPWRRLSGYPTASDFTGQGREVCYRLGYESGRIAVFIHGISPLGSLSAPWIVPLTLLHFSPDPYGS